MPPAWLVAGALLALVAAVFYPVLSSDFINMDTASHIHDNPFVHQLSWENVKHICTRPCPTSFYPVRTLTYLINYQIGGLEPRGYKLTNGLIHAFNVLLVYGILLRLLHRRTDPPSAAVSSRCALVAGFGAAGFAVHPVVVEAVAWVPAREELLMTFWILACFHFHLTAARRVVLGEPARRVWPYHIAAAIAGAAACLSNAVGAVVPLLIVAWDLIMLPRHNRKRIAVGTLPLWCMGVGTVVLKRLTDSQNPYLLDQHVSLWRNLLTVPKVFGLNLTTLAWPTRLTLDYWDFIPERLTEPPVVFGLVATVAFVLLLWKMRRHKLTLYGLAWFGLALGPTSQIMPHHILRADRFLYLPLVGFVIALVMASRRLLFGDLSQGTESDDSKPGTPVEIVELSTPLASFDQLLSVATLARAWIPAVWRRQLRQIGTLFLERCLVPEGNVWQTRGARGRLPALFAVLLLLSLGALSWRQLRTWRDSVTVWQQCLRVSPQNAVGLGGLADALAETGHFDQAIPLFEQALRLDPGNAETMNSYAYRLAMCSRRDLRDYGHAIELLQQANNRVDWKSPVYRRTLSMAYMNLATDLSRTGRVEQAIHNYRLAIEADSDYEAPMFNLALVLAGCADQQLRDVDEAILLAERACKASRQPNTLHLSILANVYYLAGRIDRAREVIIEAIQQAEAEGDGGLQIALRNQLRSWKQP